MQENSEPDRRQDGDEDRSRGGSQREIFEDVRLLALKVEEGDVS